MAQKNSPQWLTVSQLAERASVATKFIRSAIKCGDLPAYDLGVTKINWSDWEHFRAKRIVKKKVG